MQEEESRSFRLKWRLVDWNRLRIRIRLRYTSVAEPHEPWSDVLEVNRHALQRKRSTRDQHQVVSRQHEVGYCIRGREFSHLVDRDGVTLLERGQVFERARPVRSRIEVDAPGLPCEPKCVVSDQVGRRGVERLEKVP